MALDLLLISRKTSWIGFFNWVRGRSCEGRIGTFSVYFPGNRTFPRTLLFAVTGLNGAVVAGVERPEVAALEGLLAVPFVNPLAKALAEEPHATG